MKKQILIIVTIFILAVVIELLVFFTIDKKKKQNRLKIEPEVINVINLKLEVDTKVSLNDLIKGDYKEDIITNELNKKTLNLKTDNKRLSYQINYEVVDSTPPLIKGSSSYTVVKGKDVNLENIFLCGDYYDSSPKKTIEGDYNLNKVGSYNLTYVAEDSSGNKSTKDFTLKVINKSSSSSSSSSVTRQHISTFADKHKKDGVKIGIDVSEWQGNINWQKVKDDGVEFAMIRIGWGHNSNNEFVNDKKFERNLEGAKEVGIPVGVYFYSYAKTKEEAIEQAQWIVKELNGEKLDLPISFDWEEWSKFNTYNVSFRGLTEIAQAFIDEVKKNGYQGSLYSSAYYLNNIWGDIDNTWLAYWTDNNDYEKPFSMWQAGIGRVNGIGEVDIDLLYDEVQNKKTP
jgi:GH25 family lysozyme M1 (1,4-beta-N-acetylmuramidase)